MKVDVQPGSIKDQALQVIARGPVNRTQLGNSISCNGALLSIALEGMERDGWIRKNETGMYELLVEIDVEPEPKAKAGEQGGSAPGLNAVARAEPRAPRPAVTVPTSNAEDDMADKGDRSQTKFCPACAEYKRRHQDFDPGAQRCKKCVKEDRPKLKPHELVARSETTKKTLPSAPPADEQRSVTTTVVDAAPEVFVIPSTGEICCQKVGGLFIARQQNNLLRMDRDQLTAFRDWATRELEQLGSAS